jgi:pimeloyl-ACP methyl ester carboxylesterase
MQEAGDGLPKHCVLSGEVNERTGADGDQPKALASGGIPALARGFAVLSSDSGHSGTDPVNKPLGLAAGAAFGLDPQARRDYGYAADMMLAPIAKAIIAAHYGRKPDFSYMLGCSNGGRHTMVAAERMPEAYDGFLVGDPGFDLPRAAIQHAWDAQAFVKADPDIRRSITKEEAKLISRKITEACDKLDGLEDGLTANLTACQKAFDFDSLICAPGASADCLPEAKVKALKTSFAGPKTPKARRSIRIGRSTAASARAIGGCGRSKARSRPGTIIRSSQRGARHRSNTFSRPRRPRFRARTKR